MKREHTANTNCYQTLVAVRLYQTVCEKLAVEQYTSGGISVVLKYVVGGAFPLNNALSYM